MHQESGGDHAKLPAKGPGRRPGRAAAAAGGGRPVSTFSVTIPAAVEEQASQHPQGSRYGRAFRSMAPCINVSRAHLRPKLAHSASGAGKPRALALGDSIMFEADVATILGVHSGSPVE